MPIPKAGLDQRKKENQEQEQGDVPETSGGYRAGTGVGEVPNTQSGPTTSVAAYERQQAFDYAKADLNFLAALAMADVFQFNFPDIYIGLWNLVKEKLGLVRDFSKVALGFPRGFAKTTWAKLLVLYIILFTDRRYILVIAETEDKASAIISDVVDMLDEGNIIEVFGDWRAAGVPVDNLKEKNFTFRGRTIILKALGSGSSVRGVVKKNRRPDVILMDDIQSIENARDDKQARNLLLWMYGTLLKTRSPFGCFNLFLGNMYPSEGCLLAKLQDNPEWISAVTSGLLADGSSLWEELFPAEQLMADFRGDAAAGVPEVFASEILNDRFAGRRSGIDFSLLKPWDHRYEGTLAEASFVLIDPSGRKKKSDNTEIIHSSVYEGIPVADDRISGVLSPLDTVRKAIGMALAKGTRVIVVEAVAYQETLIFWAEQEMERLGIVGIEFLPIYPGAVHKNVRIKDGLRLWAQGKVSAVKPIADALIYQAMRWDPTVLTNVDDLLDIFAYQMRVLQEYGDACMRPVIELDGDAVTRQYEECEISEF